MAITRGFPPSSTISPSVRITEKDLSFIAPEQSFHRAGLVGFASKGPINIPTVIRTQRQLNTVFGFPHPDMSDPYLIYAAEQYLLVANELYVVRVADTDAVSDERATVAEVDIPSAGGQIVIESEVDDLHYTWDTDSFFKWKLNGILSSKTLVAEAGSYTAEDLATLLNSQLESTIDGIEFYNNEDYIGLRTTWAYGPDASLELISVQDSLYGPTSAIGIGLDMTVASTTGSVDRYPDDGYTSAGTWNFAGLADLNLKVVVGGTENVLIDNVVQIIDLGDLEGLETTTDAIVAEIQDQIDTGVIQGGFEPFNDGEALGLRTLHCGRDAKLLVKSDSTTNAIFGFDNITARGTSPQSTTALPIANDHAGIVVGSSNSTGAVTFTITADSAGIEGNNSQVVISNDITEGTFRIEVFNNGISMESWGYLTKDESSRFYVETYLSLVSEYIRAQDDTTVGAPPLNGTYTLTGGSDGIPSDPDEQDALLIGQGIVNGFEGIYALSETEQIELDLIAVPGHSSTTVITELLDMCQNVRMDCLAIIDPPFGLTVREIVQWQNGAHPLNTTRFDSDFGALYWPWVKIRDNYNQVDVWVPPSGSAMAVIARSDFLDAPWYAPAGARRGIVPGITDVFSRPSLEERDDMYGNRNCINPIVQYVDLQDFTVWGQKTLQRRPTALDRVNVRRLMFVIEKQIRQQARLLLFDPHDEILRDQFVDMSTGILREIQRARGIYDFRIKCDAELNTPDVIDRNEMRARIGVQPVRAAEFIFIEFSIHRTGDWGPYWGGDANSGNSQITQYNY